MYCIEEFGSKAEAVKEAKRRAWIRILELFGYVEQADIEWQVLHKRHHTFVMLTHEDASEGTWEGIGSHPAGCDQCIGDPTVANRIRARMCCLPTGKEQQQKDSTRRPHP